jgi:hypothetical protein
MDDRELLEAAARAAGLRVKWEPVHGGLWIEPGQGIQIDPWNPLTDDGDALRLAVKLRLQVHIQDYGTSARPMSKLPEAWVGCESHKMGGDHAAATRLAITRAAAQIGSEKEGR